MLKLSSEHIEDLAEHGFKPHDGGKMPVDPEQYVEPIIRTKEGFGSGGVMKASMAPFWEAKHHKSGIGAIVAYRLAAKGEERKFSNTHRFK